MKILVKKIIALFWMTWLKVAKRFSYKYYLKHYPRYLRWTGVKFTGDINKTGFISMDSKFDSFEYAKYFEIGENTIISSGVRFLVHDYSIATALRVTGQVEKGNLLTLLSKEKAELPEKRIHLYIAPPRRQKMDSILKQAKNRLGNLKFLDDEYEVDDVVVGRKGMFVAIKELLLPNQPIREYSIEWDKHVVLKCIHPSDDACIVRKNDDGELYIAWLEKDLQIKLKEFKEEKLLY